jgi:hypothetical protein
MKLSFQSIADVAAGLRIFFRNCRLGRANGRSVVRSALVLLSVLLIAPGFALWGRAGKQPPLPASAAPQSIGMPSYRDRVLDPSTARPPQPVDPEASLAVLRHACYQRETDDHTAKIKKIGGDPDKLEIAGTDDAGSLLRDRFHDDSRFLRRQRFTRHLAIGQSGQPFGSILSPLLKW